jgi:transcriptional regulator with XRE-family HTH domain
MKEQIEEILTNYQLTSAQFADLIGVQRSSISHILSGRNKPSFDFIQKILLKYPHINADWLITGRGDILNPPISNKSSENSVIEQNLFAQPPKIDAINHKKEPIISNSIDHKIIEKSMQKGTTNNEVTNVNSIKSIVLIYNDNSFEILSGR